MSANRKAPNFLVFVTDQHRADHLGCYGNTVVRTPHIDALASKGWRFERNYVASPICMPNRGSMMTGRMPSTHGARGNGVPLPLEAVTFADVLAEFGYRTALIGKSHLQNMEEQPPALAPRQRPAGSRESTQYPEARKRSIDTPEYRQEMSGTWRDPDHQLTLPYYGFQDVVLCNGHADECFGDYERWLKKEHPQAWAARGRAHAPKDPDYVAPQAWRTPVDEFAYPTHYVASQTQAWLQRHQERAPDQPFAVVCSFPDPHHPWTPPGRYWDMYDPADMKAPPTADDAALRERHVQWLWQERADHKARLDSPRLFASNVREIREIIALTYGMIANIDDRIAMVMQTLKDCGLDDDTVVVFTSDHGDLMGDHGLVLKGPLHYQGLVRTPLIWREPGGQAANVGVRTDLSSSLDLATSILQRANIDAPNGFQGRALFSADGEAQQSGRSAVLIEENQQRAYLGFQQPVQVRTAVTDRYRISVYREGDWGELYDLQDDPLETRNLWGRPEAKDLQTQLLQELAQLLIDVTDTSPRPTRLA